MTDILFCDRCGSGISSEEDANVISCNGMKSVLCDVCLDSFLDWMNDPETD